LAAAPCLASVDSGRRMNLSVLWSTGILRRATLEVVIVALVGGVIGAHVMLRRLSFLTMSIAHASFPGVVAAYGLGLSPVLGSMVMAWLLVLVLAAASIDQERVASSTLVGVALAGSLGLGAFLQSLQDQPARDLAAVLTGSVIGVTMTDIVVTAALAAVVATLLLVAHKELVFSAFDPTGARASGQGRWLDVVVELCVATTVVVTVPALGTILAPALIIIPAMTARLWTERVEPMIAIAVALGALSAIGGLLWSTQAEVAAGPAVALTATGLFGISVAVRGRLFSPGTARSS
jgi:ABC-type Mn2+/Zn2+ transport system permease subunit